MVIQAVLFILQSIPLQRRIFAGKVEIVESGRDVYILGPLKARPEEGWQKKFRVELIGIVIRPSP